MSKTGPKANSSLCEKRRLREPRRNNGIHPDVSSLEVRGRGRPRHNVVRASSSVRLPETAWELAELHPTVSTFERLPHEATPRRGKRTQPGVLTLGCVPRQATRPERAQERREHRRSPNSERRVMVGRASRRAVLEIFSENGGSAGATVSQHGTFDPWWKLCWPPLAWRAAVPRSRHRIRQRPRQTPNTHQLIQPQECHHRVPRRRRTGALQTRQARL
jgi:hypothetical protein